MTSNPWSGPINQARELLYEQTRPWVHESNSLLEGILKAVVVVGVIETDTAFLRALAGCPQPYPPRLAAMGARVGVPMGSPVYRKPTLIT
jgi:hypothetical protein